ncbi:short-chain dehydrogenase/reductase [Penicillium sp. IBT 35674x]|nr:short-chain dehydrogenase/reductase [Penicillium sp. IBT 35674x]
MSVLSFLHSQLFVTPPVPAYDFGGQTMIITGGNRGIGFEAARHLLKLNAKRVILAVRSVQRGQDAAEELEISTGRSGSVQVEELDMASHESVKAFAMRMEEVDRLDTVLLNAGMYTHEFYLADGYESHLTVNVINTVFLAFLLLPTLSFVSLDRHVMFGLPEWKEEKPFDFLSDEKRAKMQERYMISKLMLILLVREMAAHVKESYVIVNTFTPGYCESGLIDNIAGIPRVVLDLAKKATAQSHGMYLNDSLIDDSALSPFVRSEEGAQAQRRSWKDLLEILEQREPTVRTLFSP